jgi:class III poly(R)-hydroxyalkanoic acid synthase PhaE subunit
MSAAKSNEADWIAGWIEQQREQLQRLSALDKTGNAELTGQLRDLGMRWLDIVGAWNSAWAGLGPTAAMPRFSDLLEQMPPLGLAGEQTQAWRELAAAQDECQKLGQELRTVLMQVQADALALLEQRVRERERSNATVATYRELYDLWVECGEQVYAQVAHSDAYAKLQAELGNATMRLRARQQKVIERGLKQFDLPTRSELNTVHRQLRELRAKVAALETQRTDPPARRRK